MALAGLHQEPTGRESAHGVERERAVIDVGGHTGLGCVVQLIPRRPREPERDRTRRAAARGGASRLPGVSTHVGNGKPCARQPRFWRDCSALVSAQPGRS